MKTIETSTHSLPRNRRMFGFVAYKSIFGLRLIVKVIWFAFVMDINSLNMDRKETRLELCHRV